MDEFSRLYAIAQVAVAVAGFSSLVAVLEQREDGHWTAGHADRFHGMLGHEMMALLFCVLPPVIAAFADRAEFVWWMGSLLLGLQLLAHATLSAQLPSSNVFTRFGLIPAVVAIGLLAANVLRVGGGGDVRALPRRGVVAHVAGGRVVPAAGPDRARAYGRRAGGQPGYRVARASWLM